MNNAERKLYNILSLIVEDADKRKEKVIAIDSKTFKEIRGKEVKIKISMESLESMKKDVRELEDEWYQINYKFIRASINGLTWLLREWNW